MRSLKSLAGLLVRIAKLPAAAQPELKLEYHAADGRRWLAQGKRQRRIVDARAVRIQKRPQPVERIVADSVEPIVNHGNAFYRNPKNASQVHIKQRNPSVKA